MDGKDKFAERQEIVQDIIDRLIYLPEKDLLNFKSTLKSIMVIYPIDYEQVGVTRVFNHIKKSDNQ